MPGKSQRNAGPAQPAAASAPAQAGPRIAQQDTVGNAAMAQQLAAQQQAGPNLFPNLATPEETERLQLQQSLTNPVAPAPETHAEGLRLGLQKTPLIGPVIAGPVSELAEKVGKGDKNVPQDPIGVPTEQIEGQRKEQEEATASAPYGPDRTMFNSPPIPI